MSQPPSIGNRLVPGELDTLPGDIELNAGRPTVRLTVANTGDRPIQVGSHYHFFETNDALSFDRQASYGFRLDIPAGTAVRFEPGQTREIELVALAGARIVYGFAGRVMGPLDDPKAAKSSNAPASGSARTTKALSAATARKSGARTPSKGATEGTAETIAQESAKGTARRTAKGATR